MSADSQDERAPDAALIRDLERRRLRSLVDRDMTTARSLHADDYELIPPGGRPIAGTDYLGAIERGEMVYEVFEAASEPRIRMYGEAAVVRYQARIAIHGDGWRDDTVVWHTDVYEKRDGRWRAVWSQATEASS